MGEHPARETGAIYDWWTVQHGIVLCLPDQWEHKFSDMERIPDEIKEVFYLGLKSQPGSDEEKLRTILGLLQMAEPAISQHKGDAFTKFDGALMNVLDALELLEEFMSEEE